MTGEVIEHGGKRYRADPIGWRIGDRPGGAEARRWELVELAPAGDVARVLVPLGSHLTKEAAAEKARSWLSGNQSNPKV